MSSITIEEAQARLPELIHRLAAGEDGVGCAAQTQKEAFSVLSERIIMNRDCQRQIGYARFKRRRARSSHIVCRRRRCAINGFVQHANSFGVRRGKLKRENHVACSCRPLHSLGVQNSDRRQAVVGSDQPPPFSVF